MDSSCNNGTLETDSSNKSTIQKHRRKHRPKKTSSSTTQIQYLFYGKIVPSYKPTCGFIIRKKMNNNTIINIDSFVQPPDGIYQCTTNPASLPPAPPASELLFPFYLHETRTLVPQASTSMENGTCDGNVFDMNSLSITDVPPVQLEKAPKAKPKKTKENHPRIPPKHKEKVSTNHVRPTKHASAQHHTKEKKDDNTASKKTKDVQTFEQHISEQEALAGIADGSLIKGVIRINPKSHTEAYCSQDDRTLMDYYIGNVLDRNTALEGDVVALSVLPDSREDDKLIKAKVVCIIEKVHPRVCTGHLSVMQRGKRRVATFQPRDKRFPRLNILDVSLPPNFFKHHARYESNLFLARLEQWTNPKYGIGIVVENLGHESDVNAETRAILLEFSIDVKPFPPEVLAELPTSYEVTEADFLSGRLDLRGECIFTIDPLTARDLDDALHIKYLPNGNFEVGVHIADVTHFLRENSKLDRIVAAKATTTYLVNHVFHMLPTDMCLSCSLLPGRDARAFSVIWEMTDAAEVVSTRFAKTIINSCTQLAYEHAQQVIDAPQTPIKKLALPPIHNGRSVRNIRDSVLLLYHLSRQIRTRRFANGALRINQIKLSFEMSGNGIPINFHQQKIREANQMIEEFMLLANISVAEKIYEAFPDRAFLRCHDEPNSRLLSHIKETLEVMGMHLDIACSSKLQKSIHDVKSPDFLGFARYVALNHMLIKPFVRANYFCSASRDASTFRHYALSVPIYTHFTSPIRRYADVMVHRLLAACIGHDDAPAMTQDEIDAIAKNCNRQKYNAKRAGEASSEMMLAKYVDKNQPFVTEAVVVCVHDRAFDVVVLATGSVVRVYLENVPKDAIVKSEVFDVEKKLCKIAIYYPETAQFPACMQIIDIFQIVLVALTRRPKSNKFNAVLMRPGTNSTHSINGVVLPNSAPVRYEELMS